MLFHESICEGAQRSAVVVDRTAHLAFNMWHANTSGMYTKRTSSHVFQSIVVSPLMHESIPFPQIWERRPNRGERIWGKSTHLFQQDPRRWVSNHTLMVEQTVEKGRVRL